jgi:TRAP-type C4-dicarboxylate transport system substrate-binding protein
MMEGKMKVKIMNALFVCISILVAAGIYPSTAMSASNDLKKQITLKMDVFPISAVYGTECFHPGSRFEKIVSILSKGMIKIESIPGLFRTDETLWHCAEGDVAMVAAIMDYYSADMPLWGYNGLPLMYKTVDDWYIGFGQNPEVRKIIEKSFEKRNLVLLSSQVDTFNYLWGNKKVKTIEDFQGIKIRCSGMQQVSATKEIGGSPISLPFEDIIPSLERGMVDAAYLPPSLVFNLKYHKSMKYVNLWPLNVVNGVTCINKEVFEALPQEAQEILRKAGHMLDLIIWGGSTASEKAYVNAVGAAGVELIQPSEAEIKKAKTLVKGTYKKWLDKTGADGRKLLESASKALGYDLIPE